MDLTTLISEACVDYSRKINLQFPTETPAEIRLSVISTPTECIAKIIYDDPDQVLFAHHLKSGIDMNLIPTAHHETFREQLKKEALIRVFNDCFLNGLHTAVKNFEFKKGMDNG